MFLLGGWEPSPFAEIWMWEDLPQSWSGNFLSWYLRCIWVRSVECPALGGVHPLPLRGRILRQDASSRLDLRSSDCRKARVQVQTASISKVTRVLGQFLFKLAGAFHFIFQVVKSTKASLSVFVCVFFSGKPKTAARKCLRGVSCRFACFRQGVSTLDGVPSSISRLFLVGAGQGAVACSPSPARLSSFPTLSLVTRCRWWKTYVAVSNLMLVVVSWDVKKYVGQVAVSLGRQ